MRIDLYRQWLANNGQNRDYIDRCVNQATVSSTRNGAANCLAWAIEQGLCPPDRTLLDLPVSALYRVYASSENLLRDSQRSTLHHCLRFTVEQNYPCFNPPGALDFSTLTKYLEQISDAELLRPLMQALLLSPEFDFSSLKRHELKHEKDEYTVCRAVILDNCSLHRPEVVEALVKKFQPLLEEPDSDKNLLLKSLRTGYVTLCEKLTKKLSGCEGFPSSAEENLLLRMAGWKPNFSTGTRLDSTSLDWYAKLGKQAMEEHMADTFLSLIELALRHGPTPFASPQPITGLTQTDKCYYSLLAPFERLLTPNLIKSVQIATAQVARMLCLGLFYVDRAPKRGTSRLRLAPAALQTLSQNPDITPDDPRSLELVWQDPSLIDFLTLLLAELEEEEVPFASSLLLEKAPELVALLAAAPRYSDNEDDLQDPTSALTGTLTALLNGIPGLPLLQESTRLDLQRILSDLQRRKSVSDTVNKLTALLVSCHWDALQQSPSSHSVDAAQRLIDLYRTRPDAVSNALRDKADPRPGDWAFRSQLRSGESLLLAELYGRSASDCLTLASDCSYSAAQRLSWANRARSDARTAAQMALRFDEGLRAYDAEILQAKSLALLAVLCAENGAEASELLSDCIIPCAKSMLSCCHVLDTVLPEQKSTLNGMDASAFEDHRFARYINFVNQRSAVRDLLLSPSVTDVLKQNPDIYRSMPQFTPIGDAWQTLADLRIPTPANATATQFPSLWLPTPQQARVFLTYYCSYLDSETSKRKQYQPDRIEAYLLKTILSMEDVVLTVNQAADNAIIRSLAYQPGFRQLLRSGHIKVSFFGPFYTLRDFAVSRLYKSNSEFTWSSLPAEFNADLSARHIAARYLQGDCSASELPERYRALIIRFREELTLLDENLPARSKMRAYQHPNSGRVNIPLSQRLDNFYIPRQGDPLLADLCRLHFLLLSPSADKQRRDSLTRSMYQDCLDGLKHGDLSHLTRLNGICDPDSLIPGTAKHKLVESYTDPEKAFTLDLMQTVLSSCQNEMLGALCSDHQHHIYSERERLILPYNETTPINQGGCRLFQDTVTTTETGIRFGWDQAPEFLTRSEAILLENPNISSDRLAGKLAGSELDYTVSGDGGALWLARGTVHTSQHHSLLVEQLPSTGTIHLQTEGV